MSAKTRTALESHMNLVFMNFSVGVDSCSLRYVFIHLLLPLIGCPKKFHLGLRTFTWDLPGGSDGKMSAYNAGDPGSIPRSGRFPADGNGNPLQYSCLENPMDRGAWQAMVYQGSWGCKSWTQLSD